MWRLMSVQLIGAPWSDRRLILFSRFCFSSHFSSNCMSSFRFLWTERTRWLKTCAWFACTLVTAGTLALLVCFVKVSASSECSRMPCQNGVVLHSQNGSTQNVW